MQFKLNVYFHGSNRFTFGLNTFTGNTNCLKLFFFFFKFCMFRFGRERKNGQLLQNNNLLLFVLQFLFLGTRDYTFTCSLVYFSHK